MMKQRGNFLVAVLLVGVYLAVMSTAGRGQSVVGTVSGVVRDPNGAVLAGVELALRDLDTGIERKATSNSSGAYVIPSVPPGRYHLTATSRGFQTYSLQEFRLLVDEARTIDIKLSVGDISQTMTVTDEPPPLKAGDATIGTVIQNREIVQLPLNGRHFTQLILLAPGAAPVPAGQQNTFMISQGAGGISPAVNGARAQMNNFTIDGIDNNMRFTNSFGTSPPPDAIQEFKVATNQSDAQTSLAAGANINLVTKSGTNNFHGAAWEFLRNDKLAANNFIDNAFGNKRLPYRQNQYGFFVGGPVFVPKLVDGRKSRTYFATYYEGFKSRRTSTTSASVPNQQVRGGDFSQFLGAVIGTDGLGRAVRAGQIYDPLTTRACSACPSGFIRDPFPNNVIPATRQHKVAQAYLKFLYPDPNRATFPNYVLTQNTRQDSNQFGARGDHSFSDEKKLFGRFSYFKTEQRNPGALPNNPFEQNNNGVNSVLNYSHVFSPTFLINTQIGYNRVSIPFRNVPLGSDFLAAVGPSFAYPVPNGFLPATMALGGSPFSTPSFVNFDLANPDYSYQSNTDLQKVIGSHELSFGFRYMRWRHVVGSQGSAGLDFVPQTTNQPGFSGTGEALASFMIGLPTNTVFRFADPFQTYGDVYIPYIGDTWKVTPKLTLNLGLQYIYATPPVARDDIVSLFDYEKAKTQRDATDFAFAYIWAGKNPVNGQPSNAARRSIVEPDKNNFAPRFGLAYRVTEKTVIRGGYGVFYDFNTNLIQNSIRLTFGTYPYALGQQVGGQNLLAPGPNNPVINLDNPFILATATPPVPRNTLNRFNRDPYMLRWNLGVERILPGQLILSTEYVGANGKNLTLNIAENIAPAGTLPANPRRPLTRSGSFVFSTNEGQSSYHALQVTLDRRFAGGLSFRNSYTWSKAIDLISDPNAGGIEYAYDRNASRGPADFDLTHINVFSAVYDLPFGKSRTFGGNWSGVMNQLFGGWQLSGILSLRSGRRFTVTAGQDNANTGTLLVGLMRAQFVSDPLPSGFTQRREAWFDTKAFRVPAFGTLGNASRNLLRGPASQVLDLSASKDFRFTESFGLEFRAEFFNLPNHTNLGTPVGTVTSPLFGQILGAGGARDIQFALKLHW